MAKNALMSAVDFRYVLIDSYKKMNLDESELAVVLLIDHLLEQGNTFVTADSLALKMTYKPSQIDQIMVGLVNKGYLVYDTSDGKMRTSLDPLKDKIYGIFQKNLERDQANLMSQERSDRLKGLVSFYEEKLNRSLSPLESQTMGEWLDSGYSDEEIQDALLDALRANKKNLRAVDKALRAKRASADVAREGYSSVSPTWDKDIEKTIEIAKGMWGDDNGQGKK
jgi:DNA replication protein